jgi:hypothetical protein
MKTYIMKIITNAIKIIAAAQTIENQLYYCHSNSLRLNPKKRKENSHNNFYNLKSVCYEKTL